jgi:hypothetical protein
MSRCNFYDLVNYQKKNYRISNIIKDFSTGAVAGFGRHHFRKGLAADAAAPVPRVDRDRSAALEGG